MKRAGIDSDVRSSEYAELMEGMHTQYGLSEEQQQAIRQQARTLLQKQGSHLANEALTNPAFARSPMIDFNSQIDQLGGPPKRLQGKRR